jgi:hypothetical protein
MIVARPGLVVAETIMRMVVGCWSRRRVSSVTPSIAAIWSSAMTTSTGSR